MIEKEPPRPPTRDALRRWRANLRDERASARLYRVMASTERDPERAALFTELAEVELEHARHWEQRLSESGVDPGPDRPSRTDALLAWLGSRIGNRLLLPVVRAREVRADSGYTRDGDARVVAFAREERMHAEVFRLMDVSTPRSISEHERWHRGAGGGSLRAAVFGVNDGLVSSFSLVMGVAGAAASSQTVLLAGFAGMLAGAFSMAAGEYVSMKSQREMFERELEVEAEEVALTPLEEARELELIYRAKGLEREQAKQLAQRLISDPAGAIDTLAREELGLDPRELGSPWRAAFSSFAAFVVGAVFPVLPYALTTGQGALTLSMVLSAGALFGVGALLSLFTARNPLFSGLRMLGIGAAAAAITWTIGRLVGVSLT